MVNTPEVVCTPDCFETLLMCDGAVHTQHKAPSQAHRVGSSTCVSDKRGETVGRRSLVSKFPGIVDCATEFIKQHCCSAHSRRREETGTAGVSPGQIRDHLLQNIPGLKEHGISKHTVARLMEPPRRGTVASKRYQGLVKAWEEECLQSRPPRPALSLCSCCLSESFLRCLEVSVQYLAVMT